MTAYYNEFDPYAAQWLRNLITAGHIAPGFVDERSIEDVKPWELFGYTQCHFFAGIGVWSLALRRSGWPDDRPVWTASCPCQPFSAAGQGAGFNDERHLWPAFYHLASQLRPAIVLGEQVASKDAEPWIDLVQSDVEALGYTFGCVAFPSASVGAPHIRDRSYWVAYADHDEHQRAVGGGAVQAGSRTTRDRPDVFVTGELGGASQYVPDGVDNNNNTGLERFGRGYQTAGQRTGAVRPAAEASESSGLADADLCGRQPEQNPERTGVLAKIDEPCAAREQFSHHGAGASAARPPGPVNGLWANADWLYCRDGKWRPVEPGTFPLAHGAAARVGRLRAYGNALNAEAARIFIESVMEIKSTNHQQIG